MSKVACYLQATTSRLDFLLESIKSINDQTCFDHKYVSISGDGLSQEILDLLNETNWEVDMFTSPRVASFKRAVEKLSSFDYIFYTEDDIQLYKFPENVIDLLSIKNGESVCGLLSFNLGGSGLRYPHEYGDFPSIPKNVLLSSSDFVFFIRDHNYRNSFYFEFPCVFMNTQLLKRIIPYLEENQIEMELTKNYLPFVSKYYKASICKPQIFDLIEQMGRESIPNFDSQIERFKFYHLLDKNQGGINANY